MINYNIDRANFIQPELSMVREFGAYKYWRVYWDITEIAEEKTEETMLVRHEIPVTKTYEDPETGETIEYTDIEIVEQEELVITRVYESKFIEVKLPKNEIPTALEIMKNYVLEQINAYDTSSEVNGFFLDGELVWLDKDTRVGLMNSTNIQKSAGLDQTVLWLGTKALSINCDLAIQLLGGLEMYALECFNKTAEHKKDVEELETVGEIANYDYTSGYPERLNLSL